MKRKAIIFQLVFLLGYLLNLSASGKQDEGKSISIVATTSIVTDVVQNIAGDSIEIKGLIGKGGNPHNYDPSAKDMAAVEKADLIFINGFGLEENLIHALENVKTGKIVEVSSRIQSIAFEEGEHHHEAEEEHGDDHHAEEGHHHDVDPHVWMSPVNVISWADVISDALCEIDPANADVYRKNADLYKAKLVSLDSDARALFSAMPAEKKILVSDHRIFGYFAKDYEFEDLGALIPSFSTNAEVSSSSLAELIEEVDEHKVPAIFVGNTAGEVLTKLAAVVTQEVDHPVEIFPILTGSLTIEGEGSDYLSFIKYNINQVYKGLGEN